MCIVYCLQNDLDLEKFLFEVNFIDEIIGFYRQFIVNTNKTLNVYFLRENNDGF